MNRDYLAEIENQTLALSRATESLEKTEAALDEYDQEVRQLQVKHNYDALIESMNKAKEGIAAMKYQNHRSGVQMVVDIVARALRAYPDQADATFCDLMQEWKLMRNENCHVNGSNRVACYSILAELVCDDTWWAANKPQQQENKVTWVEKPRQYDWAPVVGIGIPEYVLLRLPEFKAWADKKIQQLAHQWAKDWVGKNRSDTAKNLALLEELSKAFPNS